ncbi:LysR substrate-binding domain-containing protein [Chelatococcus sp. SYSU_G07232]|uniref:LysR substrate-binding domain-containing protein n=2 Tax=Chelatococcus albus TaxID=3047466 RepID=A0ABT7ADA4_9HYPH|nr:LysR substrate-binding domain-containing protein [Chelatococcus sp. SYSU_G07232]
MRWLMGHFPEERTAFRSDRLEALAEAAATAGCLALLPTALADADARLVRHGGGAVVVERGLWLLVHPQRRRAPAVGAVVNWVEDVVRSFSEAARSRPEQNRRP